MTGSEMEFWSRVRIGDGCWEWTGPRARGYGYHRSRRAHRVAFEFANGPIPEGLHVLHRCDNPACVRVDHLFLGTHQDNMADRSAKGRQPRGSAHSEAIRRRFAATPEIIPRGSSHQNAKLDEQSVTEMRSKAASGARQCDLAREYRVSKRAVAMILARETWRHIP